MKRVKFWNKRNCIKSSSSSYKREKSGFALKTHRSSWVDSTMLLLVCLYICTGCVFMYFKCLYFIPFLAQVVCVVSYSRINFSFKIVTFFVHTKINENKMSRRLSYCILNTCDDYHLPLLHIPESFLCVLWWKMKPVPYCLLAHIL